MPVAQFTLDDLKITILPAGSGYCRVRWRLYRDWEISLEHAISNGKAGSVLAYQRMVAHMRACDVCQAHAARMDDQTSRAVYPEVKLPDWY